MPTLSSTTTSIPYMSTTSAVGASVVPWHHTCHYLHLLHGCGPAGTVLSRPTVLSCRVPCLRCTWHHNERVTYTGVLLFLAANRFIEAAIPEQLTAEQKAALRDATQSVKRKAEERDRGRGGAQKARRGQAPATTAKEAAVAFLDQLKAQTQTEAVGPSQGGPPPVDAGAAVEES